MNNLIFGPKKKLYLLYEFLSIYYPCEKSHFCETFWRHCTYVSEIMLCGVWKKPWKELTVIGEHPLWQRNSNQAMRLTTTDAYYSVGEKRATLWKIFPFVSSTSFWIALVDCCSDGVIARASKQQLSHSYLYLPNRNSR